MIFFTVGNVIFLDWKAADDYAARTGEKLDVLIVGAVNLEKYILEDNESA